MLGQAQINEIYQKRMDALSARHLHEKRLDGLNRFNIFVDWLAIAIPAGWLGIRFWAKDTPAAAWVEPIWEFLSLALLILVITKMIARAQDKAERHNQLIGENITLADQAKRLLDDSTTANPPEAQWFVTLADSLEKRDLESIGTVNEKERQWAYREALKQFTPGLTERCPKCGADPYDYLPGSCQLCGSTPIAERTSLD